MKPDKDGQSSVTEQIKITPEMVEAGLDAAADFDSDELATETTMVVRAVYEAMRRCEIELALRGA